MRTNHILSGNRSEGQNGIFRTTNETVKEAVKRARWAYSWPPLAIMGMLLMGIGVYSLFFGISKFFVISPDILFISSAAVIFFGAFYDFGAHGYQKELKVHYQRSLSYEDAKYINKQQLIMTLIYLGIGSIYVLTRVLIYLISLLH